MTGDSIVRIAIVDDDPHQAKALSEALRASGYDPTSFAAPHAALESIRNRSFDLLLSDLMMPEMSGVELLLEATRIDPQIVGILMTGSGSIETAVSAMKAGALDYILKPINLRSVLPVLERAVAMQRLKLENLRLRDTVAIHELSQAIAHTHDQEELLQKIADAALAQFEGDEASIMLLSADRTELVVASVTGALRRGDLLGQRVPVGAGVAGWVARYGEPMEQHEDAPDHRARPLHPRHDIRSSLTLPMMTRGNLVGVLNVSCTQRRRTFPVGQINVLSIFTNAAAASIRAAALLEQERKADARYREVLQMVHEGVVSIDGDFKIVVFNLGASQIFGLATEEVLGKPFDILWASLLSDVHRTGMHERRGSAFGERDRLIGRRGDGSFIHLEVGFSHIGSEEKPLTTAVMRDVTDQVSQEEKLARLTRLYTMLSGVNSAIVRTTSEHELFAEVCRIAREDGRFQAVCVSRFDALTGTLELLAAAGDTSGLATSRVGEPTRTGRLLAAAVAEGRMIWEGSADIHRTDGAAVEDTPAMAVLPFLVDGSVQALMILVADAQDTFTERELLLLRDLSADLAYALGHIEKARELNYLATHDQLTGLPNRAVFLDRLSLAIATRHGTIGPLAVVVTDIDRFGYLNHTFGRDAADELLRQLADRYRSTATDMYSLARLGADSFAVMHTMGRSTVADVAKDVAERMGLALAAPFAIGDEKVHLTARVGIAAYPTDGGDAETLLRNAEAALNRAKAQQQHLVLFTADINAAVSRQLAMEARLHRALSRHEFELLYQPKIELATGRITGAEALLRWNDGGSGLVAPQDFIPILEDTGLILNVGRWVMKEAVKASRALRDAGLPLVRIAVNVSPVQLRQDGFAASVEVATEAEGEGLHGLDIEVTEGALMRDIESSAETLRQVRDLGVGVAIDDFGSGYSSLAYLARLPADVIKIDRSFVATMANDPDHTAIISTVISLAHSLNRKVVAEGVESDEQAKLLRLLRCDEGQGFLFSRPVSFVSFVELVRTGLPAQLPASASPMGAGYGRAR